VQVPSVQELPFGHAQEWLSEALVSRNRSERTNVVTYVRWCERRTPTIL